MQKTQCYPGHSHRWKCLEHIQFGTSWKDFDPRSIPPQFLPGVYASHSVCKVNQTVLFMLDSYGWSTIYRILPSRIKEMNVCIETNHRNYRWHSAAACQLCRVRVLNLGGFGIKMAKTAQEQTTVTNIRILYAVGWRFHWSSYLFLARCASSKAIVASHNRDHDEESIMEMAGGWRTPRCRRIQTLYFESQNSISGTLWIPHVTFS